MNPRIVKIAVCGAVIALLIIIVIAGGVSRGRLSKENEVLQNTNANLVSQVESLTTNNPATSEISNLKQVCQTLQAATNELTAQITTLQAATNELVLRVIALQASKVSSAGMSFSSISESTTSTNGEMSFNKNGSIGGVLALFVNKTGKNVTLYIRPKVGPSIITQNLAPGVKRFKLPPGEYTYTCSFEDCSAKSPQKDFEVHTNSINFYDGVGPHPGGIEIRE